MPEPTFAIRTMLPHEADLAVEWAAREGWNPGLHDARCFLAADPEGFLVGLLDNVPVAAISAVRYGSNFGFLGFYIVSPAHRGKGYGLRIWNAAMHQLQGRTIGLDGVPAQQDNYRKSGFELAYRSVRNQGRGGCPAPDRELAPLADLPFEAVAGFDRRFFPARRQGFLRSWLDQPGARALAAMDGPDLAGYGVIRPCRSGFKIGPLFANDAAMADALYAGLAANLPIEAPVFLDTPEANSAALDLARRRGMEPVFETARMYAGDPPDIDLGGVFGVTSFELG